MIFPFQLLEHHPMTVAMKEGEGYLPLHLAVVYRADCELLEAVRDSYPSAALIPDAQSCLPVHYADGDSETLQILLASSAPLRKAGITSKFAQLTV